MSKLALALVLVASVPPAHADVVEPTQDESVESAEPAVLGPSMAPQQPVAETWDAGKPPLSAGRLGGEFLLGGLFVVGGGIGGAYAGASLELARGCHGEFCGLGGVVLGGLTGVAIAAPVGVYLAGSHSGQTASFGATLGGSVIGTLVGAAGVVASERVGTAVVFGFAPVVGAMIGFNATRRYTDSHRKRRAWVPVANVSSGNSTFGVVGQF
jgi:hypothetical protein